MIRSTVLSFSRGIFQVRGRTLFPQILTLALIILASNFLFASYFGLYEDDYIFFLPGFTWTKHEAWQHIVEAARGWPQGRPVAFTLNCLFAFLCGQASTLAPAYVLGYCILLVNAGLLLRLASRFMSPGSALFAAAIYVLYPAFSSKALIAHLTFTHLNVTFLLAAFLLYTGGRRIWSYFFAGLCFLTYETVFVIFLIAPLLVTSRQRLSFRRCLFHWASMTCMAVLLLLVRRSMGDPRIAETFGSVSDTAQRALTALYVGPLTVLGAFFQRPWDALRSSDSFHWCFIALTAAAFYFSASTRNQSTDEESDADYPSSREGLWLVLFAGTLGLVLGYALCFRDDYWPPIVTLGRLSAFHVAGSIGASLACGALLALLLSHFRKYQLIISAAAALYCGLLVSFGIEVQRADLVRNAQQQANLWHQILDTSGEWEPDTVILVDISGTDTARPYTPGLPVWWVVNYTPLILDKLVEWPARWNESRTSDAGASPRNPLVAPNTSIRPRVYGFDGSLPTESNGDKMVIKTPTWMGPSYWPNISDDHFIYFKYIGGRMVRQTQPVTIGQKNFTPRGIPPEAKTPLPTTRLYKVLFHQETSWTTITKARNYPR